MKLFGLGREEKDAELEKLEEKYEAAKSKASGNEKAITSTKLLIAFQSLESYKSDKALKSIENRTLIVNSLSIIIAFISLLISIFKGCN